MSYYPTAARAAMLLVIGAALTASVASAQIVAERQSPINITTRRAIEAHGHGTKLSIVIDPAATFSVKNTYQPQYNFNGGAPNGSYDALLTPEFATLKASVISSNSYLTVNGETYHLLQFHFHTPSEHTVDGKRSAMEVHFVWTRDSATGTPLGLCNSNPDGLLVTGARIKVGEANRELNKIFSRPLPVDATDTAKNITSVALNIGKILPSLDNSWRYEGSLTAPASSAGLGGCTPSPVAGIDDQATTDAYPENVSWVVLSDIVTLSQTQVSAFRALFPDSNTRPTQDLNGRTVKHVRD